jgi:hypothetical protein
MPTTMRLMMRPSIVVSLLLVTTERRWCQRLLADVEPTTRTEVAVHP